jgi:thiamine transport system ATP-binding protein
MLDEPLGALDRALRTRLLDELAALFAELQMPILYVTHDQEEAFTVSDRVVIMRDGRAAAVGTPVELWSGPPDAWTATFLGFSNVAEGLVRDERVQTPWGAFALPGAADGEVTVVLRPEALSLSENGTLQGPVVARRFHGDHVRVVVATSRGATLELEVRDGDLPEVGQRVAVAVNAARINVLR